MNSMTPLTGMTRLRANVPGGLCLDCGTPLDAKPFDASGFDDAPTPGREVVLARFELAPQYCGVLDYFSQFTDTHAANRVNVETPGLQWLLMINRRPMDPYLDLEHIVNPWGYGSFKVGMRLDEASTIELVVRCITPQPALAVATVGGRIAGRYWYNVAYGDGVNRR
jgi:hypothetical protein